MWIRYFDTFQRTCCVIVVCESWWFGGLSGVMFFVERYRHVTKNSQLTVSIAGEPPCLSYTKVFVGRHSRQDSLAYDVGS